MEQAHHFVVQVISSKGTRRRAETESVATALSLIGIFDIFQCCRYIHSTNGAGSSLSQPLATALFVENMVALRLDNHFRPCEIFHAYTAFHRVIRWKLFQHDYS
jgi:hypothetical protein